MKYIKLEKLADSIAKWTGSIQSLITHSILFIFAFAIYFFGISLATILLIVTTIVSLEAIYLSIFVQMTINKHSKHLKRHTNELKRLKK